LIGNGNCSNVSPFFIAQAFFHEKTWSEIGSNLSERVLECIIENLRGLFLNIILARAIIHEYAETHRSLGGWCIKLGR
jgi:hypothetical protein